MEIDKELYPNQSLTHDIQECRARLQFKSGTIYTLEPIPVLFVDEKTGQPHTAHTTNPVPLILFDSKKRFGSLRDGGALENVAPTLLTILGIDRPKEMTATSLLK